MSQPKQRLTIIVEQGDPLSATETEQLEDDLVDLLLAMHAKQKAECAAKMDVGRDSPQNLSK